ncbi:Endocuticle structural glycoprotein SgAbd-2 [Folsomia candida]|uniref:Endocuticle structural glycoprotein SgAbd-2 n=1 Tax=Folsomia candida TaxID=158441 RepID=A0A226EKI7_FOLCA|nr:Endocuticle structural glycoprotein SgAbd-2 [Folsomia candida]
MMQRLLFLTVASVCLAGFVSCKPQSGYNSRQDERYAHILRYDNINHGDGTYSYNYETSNGIKAEENGYLKGRGTNNEIQTVQGSYQYYSPEGELIRVVYTADENGFNPSGDHLPTPPPIPPVI